MRATPSSSWARRLLFLALWLRFPPIDAVIYAVMCSGLIAACLIDLDHFIIPDRFTLGGCVAGFIACAAHPALMGREDAAAGLRVELRLGHDRRHVAAGHRVDRDAGLQERGDGHGRREVHRRDLRAFSARFRSLWTIVISSLIGAILGLR